LREAAHLNQHGHATEDDAILRILVGIFEVDEIDRRSEVPRVENSDSLRSRAPTSGLRHKPFIDERFKRPRMEEEALVKSSD